MSALREELRVTAGLTERWFREVFYAPVAVFVLLAVKPVVWYFLFGSLFEGITALPSFPTESYRSFILPGIAVLIALEYISLGGQCITEDFSSGFLHKLWSAPINKASAVAGRAIVMATMVTLQTSLLLVLAVADGVHFESGIGGMLVFLALIVLFTTGTTAVSMILAYAVKYEFAFSAVSSFLVLPVLFVSNAFMPTGFMPDWLATIADLNPVSITTDALRSLVVDGWVFADLWPAVTMLVGFAVGASLVAVYVFNRKIETESSFGL